MINLWTSAGGRLRRPPRDEAGMTTAEYAVGTLAACGFAGVLWVVVHSGEVHSLLQSVVSRALNLAP
jgi:Protein of unknown function (DUF4244)